jgi:hypothetical protein
MSEEREIATLYRLPLLQDGTVIRPLEIESILSPALVNVSIFIELEANLAVVGFLKPVVTCSDMD